MVISRSPRGSFVGILLFFHYGNGFFLLSYQKARILSDREIEGESVIALQLDLAKLQKMKTKKFHIYPEKGTRA